MEAVPRSTGPFGRSVREALETMLSAAMAADITAEALAHASLEAVPEEIGAFRRFCEGPLRFSLGERLEQAGIEQVFERLGHVLWMATSDVSALETARSWSHANPFQPPEPESGVRDVQDGAPARPANQSGARLVPKQISPSPPGSVLGRLGRGVARSESPTQRQLDVPGATQDPREALPVPTPVQPPSTGAAPSSVVVVTLDSAWIAQLRLQLAPHCAVRPIAAPRDLAAAVAAGGERLVVLVDTALPSIDVATFAGLATVLPATARVVLWGATPKQHARLAAMFPLALGWLTSGDATDAGRFVLELA